MKGKTGFLSGVKNDLISTTIILGIVFIFSSLLGVSLILIMSIGKGLALFGSIFFIVLTPIFLIAGYFVGRWFYTTVGNSNGGIFRPFKEKQVHPGEYSKKYRNRFIQQRFVSLSIMISIFILASFILGMLLIIPELCCICFPISFPILLVAITTPAVGWVMFAYAFDPYEPEPRPIIVLAIAWGMISTFPSLFLNTFNSTWMEPLGIEVAIASAPIFEEFFKAIGFVLFLSYIKDETDGIIYGAAIGAGFALLENLYYTSNTFLEGGGLLVILLLLFRSFFNIVGHMIGPVVIGFLIGLCKCQYRGKKDERSTYRATLILYTAVGYVFGVLIHASWNFLAIQESLIVLLILPFGIFEILLYFSLVLGAFYLGTKRYKDLLRSSNSI
jgi:RsiW-degrading membrane proteinase PrsW (M82 family)